MRTDAIAAVTRDVWRKTARPEYLNRIEHVRFSADWARSFVAGALPPALPPDAQMRLAALGLPILMLHGRHDFCFPANLAEQAGTAIPRARTVILAEAGHMAHIDQPRQWITTLATFLDNTSHSHAAG